jgi:hypothetical protein
VLIRWPPLDVFIPRVGKRIVENDPSEAVITVDWPPLSFFGGLREYLFYQSAVPTAEFGQVAPAERVLSHTR